MNKEVFENISKTGVQFLILRDIGKCECVKMPLNNKTSILSNDNNFFGLSNTILEKTDIIDIVDDIEVADPNCEKCFGTGVKFFKILTNKIRYSNLRSTSSGTGGETETQYYELIKEDTIFLYFPYYYDFLTMKDYLCLLETDSNNEIIKPIKFKNIYKIVSIDEYIDGDFKYFKINASKKKVI